jgi:hypothetical protein
VEGRGRSATRSSGTISGRAASAGGASSASYNISQPFDSATPSTVRRWTSMLTPLLACSTEIDLDSRLGCQGDQGD